MTYNEILEANPGLATEAAKLAQAVKIIVDAVKRHGMGTAVIMTIVTELGKIAMTSFPLLQSLSNQEKVVVLGEAFDGLIGVEETAILTQLGFLKGDALEAVSDGVKIGFASFALEQLENETAAA